MTTKHGIKHLLIRPCIALALAAVLAPASLADFSGSLSTVPIGGLVGGGSWANGGSLEWAVSFNDALQRWSYSYILEVPDDPAISHFIVEVSDDDPGPAFTSEDLFGPASDPEGWISEISIRFYTSSPSNPGMPDEGIYGIKFDATQDEDLETLKITIEFDSDRVPVWGDFYAKGGSDSYIYNSGLGYVDPLADPHDGPHWSTVQLPTGASTNIAHLLVPDSKVVPAPGAVVLGSLGLAFAGWLRRRKMMS